MRAMRALAPLVAIFVDWLAGLGVAGVERSEAPSGAANCG